MALIKCSECGKEMSNQAKMCPHCGRDNDIMFCTECGKQVSSKAQMCPNCGYAFHNNYAVVNDRGENYNMALAALICSFFISIVGLVLGIIALNSNKGKANSAKTMATIAVIISSFGIFIYFFVFMCCIAAIGAMA